MINSLQSKISNAAAKTSLQRLNQRTIHTTAGGLKKDTFARESIKEIAKSFREIEVGVEDFKIGLPANTHPGSKSLKILLDKYSKILESRTPKEVEQFTKYVFGTDHLEALEKGVHSNTSVENFVGIIEEKAGKTIRQILGN